MHNVTSSDRFLLYENPEYYSYLTISASGILISTICLIYILKKLILNWIIQLILIAMSIHEILGFSLFFLGIVLSSHHQDYISCTIIFTPFVTIHGTTIFLASLMSIIRYYMAWKTNRHQVPIEKDIAKTAILVLLGHYVIVGTGMCCALTTPDVITQISVCDGSADFEKGHYSRGGAFLSCYYVLIITCGAITDMAMIAFLRKKTQSPETIPTQLVPWKSGGSQFSHKVPTYATLMSLVLLAATIVLSLIFMSFLQAERLLWNLFLAAHTANMCFLPLILHFTVKNGLKTHPAPPQDLQFHEDTEDEVRSNRTQQENLDISPEKPSRCISVQLQQRVVIWTSTVESI